MTRYALLVVLALSLLSFSQEKAIPLTQAQQVDVLKLRLKAAEAESAVTRLQRDATALKSQIDQMQQQYNELSKKASDAQTELNAAQDKIFAELKVQKGKYTFDFEKMELVPIPAPKPPTAEKK